MKVQTKRKVLIIEDDRTLRMAMESVLGREFDVETAADGQKGLQKINDLKTSQGLPNLILLDLIMPGIQGWEVLKMLKQDPETAPIPVIIVSNLEQESDKNEIMESGAAGYLIKANLSLKTLAQRVKDVWKEA